ncbi:MAG: DUF115 domain-containing protein [Candidatus Lokiarchaeota archaeon]|nr:DUF115 domain-containing protein [Candidatus Lokiarchaeota archaeon]
MSRFNLCDNIMNWFEWESYYNEIKNSINLSFEKDIDAAKLLNEQLDEIEVEETLREVAILIDNNTCHIFGCGPSLEFNIEYVMEKKIIKRQDVIIAADGATKALLMQDIAPDIIVSDLDGDIEAIKKANKRGSIIIIHAHGDNLQKIQELTKEYRRRIGSVQIKPFGLLKNFGGFTDGDRAVFLAEHFNARKICLYGFDFGKIVGKYSKARFLNDIEGTEEKITKLKIAKDLISMLHEKRAVEIKNCTELYLNPP